MDALTAKTVRVVPTGSIVEGFAALLAYDPAPSARQRRGHGGLGAPGGAGEVTRAVRDADTEAGPVHDGRLDRAVARRGGVGRRLAGRRPPAPCSDRLVTDRPRARHPHRGRGGDGRPTPAASPSGCTTSTPTSPPRCTTAASRSTRTSSASSDPTGDRRRPDAAVAPRPPTPRPHSSRQLAELPVDPCCDRRRPEEGGGAARAAGSRPSSTCSPPTRGATSTAPARPTWPTWRWATRRWSWPRCARSPAPADPQGRVAGRARRCSTAPATMKVVFFNQPWRAKQLPPGTQALFFGQARPSTGGRARWSTRWSTCWCRTEETSLAGRRRTLRIVPVYPASAKAGLTSWEIGTWVAEALRAGPAPSPTRCPRRGAAGSSSSTAPRPCEQIHLPESMADTDPARRRLAFDELFRLQLALVLRRRALEQRRPGHPPRGRRRSTSPRTRRRPAPGAAGGRPDAGRRFLAQLPFELTGAQRRALAAIFADLAGPLPMHRLLQGDVGSGKTVVAVAALLAAVQGGHQGALMVPTEVLAEQHYIGVAVARRRPDRGRPGRARRRPPAGGRPAHQPRPPAAERTRLHRRAGHGRGRHRGRHPRPAHRRRAVPSLGVVVIDEQHRFGVEQRAALRDKGRVGGGRTAAERGRPRPAGHDGHADPPHRGHGGLRRPRHDRARRAAAGPHAGRRPSGPAAPLEEAAAWERVRDEVAAGHRAYVVCPLVEGSERVAARSAAEEPSGWPTEELAGLRARAAARPDAVGREGGGHGRLPGRRDRGAGGHHRHRGGRGRRRGHRDGDRGRRPLRHRPAPPAAGPGRAQRPRQLVLPARARRRRPRRPSGSAALERTTDGFELAEVDLELRGEGTILGARQKGRSDLQLASLRPRPRPAGRGPAGGRGDRDRGPRLAAHPLLADELRSSSTRRTRPSCSRADASRASSQHATRRAPAARDGTVAACG